MMTADKPDNERERLLLLTELEVLDTPEEQSYDDLTSVAAMICGTSMALVSLVDEERQWFKSHHGLAVQQAPRDHSFCAHAILQDEVLQVPDAHQDKRFFDYPLVAGSPSVRFYAGAPLILRNDLRVGTLCVLDPEPKMLSDEQIAALEALGRQVVAQLESRLKIKEMEALEKMKTEFVAMVSHELRTPLTSIYGSLSILDSGLYKAQPEKIEMLIGTARSNAERLRRIVNDILDLTRLEAGRFDIQSVPADFNQMVQGSIEGMSGYLNKCGVIAKLELASHLPVCSFDDARMFQVINNLVSNAAKFSPSGSTITLVSRLDRGNIVLEVRDEGMGIPKDQQSEIFSKFSTLNVTGGTKLPGTGLGLSIARELVELHDGCIWFETAEGMGTSFFVSLPTVSHLP
jgi:signal transduction histidine kinase